MSIPATDQRTADAFATSWNNLPEGSVYSTAQFEEWFAPLTRADVEGRRVVELGCGGGSLLTHISSWAPSELIGVDLGSSVEMAERNMTRAGARNFRIVKHDLTTYAEEPCDLAYCIGVLHHLKDPRAGFDAVLRNTLPGGRFHCWVYAHEGNAVIRWIVDPVRKIASLFPWWFTKYAIATPMVVPYFLYAKTLNALRWPMMRNWPLYDYSLWISQRGFAFFRHVAFDQLVTPSTVYIHKRTVEEWLRTEPIDPSSTYAIFRNGNSWKFGGRMKA
ncbi:MAG: class I SAM-dependent methyltransferase [Flavobacteriales bacterium]|nr:class I SAM-dependent methyltransferase [Flavobacteriales bacterium]